MAEPIPGVSEEENGRKGQTYRKFYTHNIIIYVYPHTQSQSIITHESPFHKHSESKMLRAARRGSLFHSDSLTLHARCYYWANDPELTIIYRERRNAEACAVCI